VRDLEDMAAPRSTGVQDGPARQRVVAGDPVTVIVAWERSHRNISDSRTGDSIQASFDLPS
jgi:hypothetical protein